MNYYGVIFYRGDAPNGKAYTFKSQEEFHHGDIVELFRRKKGMIAGTVKEDDIDYDLSKIQTIVGKWKDGDADAE